MDISHIFGLNRWKNSVVINRDVETYRRGVCVCVWNRSPFEYIKLGLLDPLHEAVEYRVGNHIWDLEKAENINRSHIHRCFLKP